MIVLLLFVCLFVLVVLNCWFRAMFSSNARSYSELKVLTKRLFKI